MTVLLWPVFDLVLAAVLGGLIGIQRQAAHKPAGFRTHILVSTGCCAFTLVGLHYGDSRIAANVLTGIGFLGAGAIVREGLTARGLTTAATIWIVAAIGTDIAFGNDYSIVVGVATTGLTLVTLSFSDRALLRTFRLPQRATLAVTFASPATSAAQIVALFGQAGIAFESSDVVSIVAEGDVEIVEMHFLTTLPTGGNLNDVIRSLCALSGVRRVEASEPSTAG